MTAGPSTEQLLVQVALRALDELIAALSADGAEATDTSREEEAQRLAFTQLWHRLPALHLECMSDGLWWHGARVLSVGEARSALLPTLTSAGIHALTLKPGAEEAELRRFAELVVEKAHGDEHGARDLAMMIFKAELDHIGYSLTSPKAPDGVDARAPDAPASTSAQDGSSDGAPPAELKEAIRADVQRPARPGVVDLESFDSTLYFLDEREIEYLRFAVEKQYSIDQTRSVLGLLLDTLELQADAATRDEVIEALRAFLPYLLGTGNYTSLAYLTNELRIVLEKTELDASHRAGLSELLASVSDKGALTQLFLTLEDGRVTPTAQSLQALVEQLDRPALETVLVWSGQLRRAEVKAALLQALETVFRRRPEHLSTVMGSGSRAVVQSGLAMAGRIRSEELVDGASMALQHDDATIRRQAVEVLGGISGTPAIRGVARVLRDPDAEVRKAAYRVFLNRPYRSAAKPLREILTTSDLESLGLSERKLLFSAYGAAASAEDVYELTQLVAGKRAFGGKPSPETRACAVLALERIGTPAAREALAAATRYPDPLVRSAAASALRGDG